jgi:hypothetical protein
VSSEGHGVKNVPFFLTLYSMALGILGNARVFLRFLIQIGPRCANVASVARSRVLEELVSPGFGFFFLLSFPQLSKVSLLLCTSAVADVL